MLCLLGQELWCVAVLVRKEGADKKGRGVYVLSDGTLRILEGGALREQHRGT